MQPIFIATNPVQQIVWWGGEMVDQVGANWSVVSQALAVGILVYVLAILYRRMNDDTDPSIRIQRSSGAGSASVLISGVTVTVVGVGAITLLLWPIPIQNLGIAVFLVGLVVVHYYIERKEVSG